MARTPKAAGGGRGGRKKATHLTVVETGPNPRAVEGDNSAAMAEALAKEEAALRVYVPRIRAAQADIEKAQAVVKEKRDVLNTIFAQAKAERNFKRKDLTELVAAIGTKVRDQAPDEARRARWRDWFGLPVGTQGNLFEQGRAGPKAAMDELEAEAEGYKAARSGLFATPPDWLDKRLHTAFARGFDRGTEENGASLKKLEPEAKPEPEEDFELSEAELRKQAGRVKERLDAMNGGDAADAADAAAAEQEGAESTTGTPEETV